MYHVLLISKRSLVIIILAFVTACTTYHSAEETVRICNSGGCFDRPKDYAAPDSPATKITEKNPQIQALEKLALEDPGAAYDLGLRYFRADGIRQDSYQAIKWMRDAAERGNLKAQMALGRLYLTGFEEMGSDPGEAEKWLSITSSKGDKEAADLLKEATKARRSKQARHQLENRWRPNFYNNWSRNYPYNWQWGANQWIPMPHVPPVVAPYPYNPPGNAPEIYNAPPALMRENKQVQPQNTPAQPVSHIQSETSQQSNEGNKSDTTTTLTMGNADLSTAPATAGVDSIKPINQVLGELL